jgi:hypothetical protein
MPAYPTLSTRVIGQAEKSLNAILGRQLAGTGLTEAQWVVLTLAVAAGGTAERDRLTHMVANMLKISEEDAETHIDILVAARHLQITSEGSAVTVTGAARQLHSRVGSAVAVITHRLWGDLPAEDLATAGRVLTIVTDRANTELTRENPSIT